MKNPTKSARTTRRASRALAALVLVAMTAPASAFASDAEVITGPEVQEEVPLQPSADALCKSVNDWLAANNFPERVDCAAMTADVEPCAWLNDKVSQFGATLDCATGTVSGPQANQPPVAADDAYTITAGAQFCQDAPGFLANDSDPDGDALTIIFEHYPSTGVLAPGGQPWDGSFCYGVADDVTGTTTARYWVSDGTTTSAAPATITFIVEPPVNHVPVASDDSYSVVQNAELTIPAPGILANDSDPEGGLLTAQFVSLVDDNAPHHGAVWFDVDGPGSFRYVPDPGFVGTDHFNYRVVDEGGAVSEVATVTIEVTAAPAPPELDPPATEPETAEPAPPVEQVSAPEARPAALPAAGGPSGATLWCALVLATGGALMLRRVQDESHG